MFNLNKSYLNLRKKLWKKNNSLSGGNVRNHSSVKARVDLGDVVASGRTHQSVVISLGEVREGERSIIIRKSWIHGRCAGT